MNTRLLEYILNGSIVINSLDVLGHWVKHFPDNPQLLKIYANLLAANSHLQAAANHYDRVTRIYLKEGQFLSGIATKIAQWQAVKPKKEEVERFISEFQGQASDGKPATAFWKNMTADELLDLYQIVENVCYSPGITVKQLGEVEGALNFVVSGELKESNYRMIEDQQVKFKKPIQVLKPNDIFGVVYPFSEEIRSQSHIVTLNRTELINIKKEKIITLCRVHSHFEAKIIELLQIRNSGKTENGSTSARKAKRYSLATPIAIEIIADKDIAASIRITGFARDWSVSGLCFLMPDNHVEDSHQTAFKAILNGHKPEVRVILSIEKMSLVISGKIVRKEKVVDHGKIYLSLGIRFDDLPPMLGGAFFAFAQTVGFLNQGGKVPGNSPEQMD
jgi:hypothetical protein